MNTPTMQIRLIQEKDNAQIRDIILAVLTEYGCIGPGYASNDSELDNVYQAYLTANSRYWVIEDEKNQALLGGSGIGPLKGTHPDEKIAELLKLYILPQARGKGLGSQLIRQCIKTANELGFETLYLETVPQMKDAIRLYEKVGFKPIEHPLGNTGHSQNCPIRMLRDLL